MQDASIFKYALASSSMWCIANSMTLAEEHGMRSTLEGPTIESAPCDGHAWFAHNANTVRQ